MDNATPLEYRSLAELWNEIPEDYRNTLLNDMAENGMTSIVIVSANPRRYALSNGKVDYRPDYIPQFDALLEAILRAQLRAHACSVADGNFRNPFSALTTLTAALEVMGQEALP